MFKGIVTGKASKSSAGLLVLVLILGSVGAQASGVLNSPSGGYLLCVAPKSSIVTHPSTAKCPAGSEKLILGAEGQAGATGLTGATGLPGKDGVNGEDGKTLWNGVKDPESTWGAPGDMFINSVTKTLFGPKDLTTGWPAGVSMVGPMGARGPQGPEGPGGSGPAGPQGPAGAAGAIGPQGPAGAIGPQGPTGAAGANGPAGPAGANGVAAPIATGSNCIGTKCTYKIGDTGPGGGIIFFVDYNDQYSGFDYLEASPTSCQSAGMWWTGASSTFPVSYLSGWTTRAIGAGKTTTASLIQQGRGDGGSNIYNNAALFATSCIAGNKSDWFLGSVGEMKLMYDNLQGLGGLLQNKYWTSSNYSTTESFVVFFKEDSVSTQTFTSYGSVRPIRSF